VRTIEVVLYEQPYRLEITFTDLFSKMSISQKTTEHKFESGPQGVTLDGYTVEQAADKILKPLFDTFH
jgi:hypothetical protein